MYNNILTAQKGQVLTVTIDRPKQLNALNKETISELHLALNAANDDRNVGVVILTGSGE
ncbi:enoyl-CoA hydratase-related protein, partial [Crocinitomicaceae bacterium]|nr:enoyl-CoA hydratase-related protein [Crocinitomicaceae bacterium]